jgi:uncharacterized protein (DUF2252 family)
MKPKKNDLVLDAILAENKGRNVELVKRKLDLMSESVFAFFRASNGLFAREWRSLRPQDPGPLGLICGDLHLENFGAYLTDNNDCRYAINDFDEAYIAPVAYDLVRCSASILLAAEEWSLRTSTAAAMVVEFLDAYRKEVATCALSGAVGQIDPLDLDGPILELILPTAIGSREQMLAKETEISIKGTHPLILLNEKRERVSKKLLKTLQAAFDQLLKDEPERHPQVTSIKVLDATTRIAGLGSLGVNRYLVLIQTDRPGASARLLDVKEIGPSALAQCIQAAQPHWGENEACRVIKAEQLVLETPASGLAAITIGTTAYRVKDTIPDANRSKISRFKKDVNKLREAVKVAGSIAAWAHVRGCDAAQEGRSHDLNTWSNGPSFDAVMVAGARAADRCRCQYDAFCLSLSRKSVRKELGLAAKAAPATAKD